MPDSPARGALLARYDVAIAGGGLAGLALARQLSREEPGLSIFVAEKSRRPLHPAAHKVGESTVEVAGLYLAETLGLDEHLRSKQFFKCGLRYFFGDSRGPLAARPELGLSRFPLIDSWQLDRGALETELREKLDQTPAVHLAEGLAIESATLNPGDEDHALTFVGAPAGEASERVEVRARWLVDATGRRRFLSRKLGLASKLPAHAEPFHAAWFRVPGRVDVERFVSDADTAWHGRVVGDVRYFATVHMMGEGYWVWLIPLASGHTSIGIVAAGGLYPFESMHTHALAMAWLEAHEPAVAHALAGKTPVDFLCLRDFSHTVTRIFSSDRWACVGDAGAFSDPFYSPGTWQIGVANSMVTDLIGRDRRGTLTPAEVDRLSKLFITINDEVTTGIQTAQRWNHRPVIGAVRILWDFLTGWSLQGPLVLDRDWRDDLGRDGLRTDTRFWRLTRVMRSFFGSWAAKPQGALTYGFVDYQSVEFVHALYKRVLRAGKTAEQLAEDRAWVMNLLEDYAQATFLIALEDVMPEAFAELGGGPRWMDAWSISLDRGTWARRGLLTPKSPPRDIGPVYRELRRWFKPAVG